MAFIGTIFDIQRFALHDGPGTRTVVFFKGCPLRCKWCHNPEGQAKKPEISYNPYRCIGCGECVQQCGQGLHRTQDGKHVFFRNGCEGCGRCATECCSEALKLVGREMTAKEVLAQVEKDRMYYQTGGGLTLSGGEPMFQADFALELLRDAKKRGICTCMETSGYAPAADFEKIIPYTDFFLYDYKVTGNGLHRETTGVPNGLILDNLAMLCSHGCRVVLRCPVIPGINDNPEHIRGISNLANRYPPIERIELEPYHDMWRSKAEFTGRKTDFTPPVPSIEKMQALCSLLKTQTNIPVMIS